MSCEKLVFEEGYALAGYALTDSAYYGVRHNPPEVCDDPQRTFSVIRWTTEREGLLYINTFRCLHFETAEEAERFCQAMEDGETDIIELQKSIADCLAERARGEGI